MEKGIVVDGARPSVEWVTSLPRAWRVTPPERLILITLACDAFDWESAPGFEAIAAWTGMQRTSCIEILGRLCESTDVRPALLERISVRGRRRTIWRLLGDMAGQPEPVDVADRFTDGTEAPEDAQPSANQSTTQNGSGHPTVGEPVGVADRFQPSANRSAPQNGWGPDGTPTVGEPSANRSATPTAPFPLTQEQEQRSKSKTSASEAAPTLDGLLVMPDGMTERMTVDEQFDAFWKVYPRKVGKDDARKVWDRRRKQVGAQTIRNGAIRFAEDPNLPQDRNFIPHPSTWLSRGGWEDEPLPPPRNGTSAQITRNQAFDDPGATFGMPGSDQ